MKQFVKHLHLFGLLMLPFSGWSTDTLTIEQCRSLALQSSPLQQKKMLANSIADLQIRNIQSNNLPRISVGAQATLQSDVFGFPINSPLFDIPKVPKDQYKINVDIGQRIYDGGTDRFVRDQRTLESQIAAAQVEVDVFQLREVVTGLYLNALLLQESGKVLSNAQNDLQSRLKQTEAMVKEGVALRSAADQVRIQILKTEQQLAAVQSDEKALLQTLAQWIGREKGDFALTDAGANTPLETMGKPTRPESILFDLQQKNLQLAKDGLRLKSQPRVEAFAQAGFGRPNPFNFFETGFEPFAMVGVRAIWTPWDWGNKGRDAQVIDLQAQNIGVQRQTFDQRLDVAFVKDRADIAKMQAQLQQDDAIIALQEDIIRRADAQVKNGVMTMTDYLAQESILTQARLTRATHLVQRWQAVENLRAKGVQ